MLPGVRAVYKCSMTHPSNRPADVVIAGAGIPGLTLALALSRALKPGFSVVVCDPSLAVAAAADDRVSAITASARQMLEALGTWPRISDAAQPVHGMEITDSKLEDAVRPSFLNFEDAAREAGEPLAHIVEHRALAAALREAVAAEGVELLAKPILGFECADESVAVSLGENSLAAKLLVAADGARSKLRAQARIPSVSSDYKQMGIVATIGHERDHQGIATQHFLPAGTFAILPLTRRRSSIVWAEKADEARRIVALAPDEFKQELPPPLRDEARRDRGALIAARLSAFAVDRAKLHRRAARATRRRRACGASAGGAGA